MMSRPPIAPWEPPDATGLKEDPAARFRQFLRILSVGLSVSDHQHRSDGQIGSAAIAGSVDRVNVRRQLI
jgi:hypothetical protein